MARLCLFAAVLVAGLLLIPMKSEDRPARAEPETPTLDLCLEVQALRSLYLLRVTPEQVKKLQVLAKELSVSDREREKPRVSDGCRGVIARLHAALAADDEDKVEKLEDQLSELIDSESPELDDAVEITAAARRRVAEALRVFRPQQLASYLGSMAEEIGDPQERLVAALAQVRSDETEDWEAVRDELAEDLGWLLGGLDVRKAGAVREDVAALLDKAHGLTDVSFEKQRARLEKRARDIGADVASTEVLQHALERTLARLLSNPRLAEALQSRSK